MRIAVLNGPNLNLLGQREPEVYGRTTLSEIEAAVREAAKSLDADIHWFQTNHEGALVEEVQGLRGRADGALINAAALTHSSLALRDALLAVKVPFVELHLSNIFAREPERRHSLIADLALGLVSGFGAESYRLALQALVGRLRAAGAGHARGDGAGLGLPLRSPGRRRGERGGRGRDRPAERLEPARPAPRGAAGR